MAEPGVLRNLALSGARCDSPHDARRAVVAVWATTLLLVLVTDLLTLWQHRSGVAGPESTWFEVTAFTLAYAVLGAVVSLRAPGNRMGRLMLAIAMCGAAQGISGALAGSAGQLWLSPQVADWLNDVSAACQTLAVGGIAVLLLLAPTGHPLTPRWRIIVGITAVGVVANATAAVFFRAARDTGADVTGAAGVANALLAALGLGVVLGLLASPVCLGLRWHRAHGLARQQVTWVALGGIAGPVLIILSSVMPFLSRISAPIDDRLNGSLLWALATTALPAGIAISVLRHQLYDIDRIVSRTTAYVVVTGVLLAVYAVVVTAVSVLLPKQSGSFSVAAATLAAAALFRPVLSRVQAFVDRRFNRSRYDAQRTVEAFAGRLRDEVTPDAVSADLLAVLQMTVQPARVGLWLRENAR